MNAVDSNIYLYSYDDADRAKQVKAQIQLRALLSTPSATVLLWQVLGESVKQLRKWLTQGKLTKTQYANHLFALRSSFSLITPTMAVLDHALDLADRYSLSHWDSMLLGACKDAGVTTLFTEDMGSPRSIDQIQLVNPLA